MEDFFFVLLSSSKRLLLKLTQLLLFLVVVSGFSQSRYTLSGTITEASSGETLIGVNVLIPELNTGTASNEYGFYSITLPEGTYEVVFTSLGFGDIRQTIVLTQNIVQDIAMAEDLEQLDEVLIEADVEQLNIRSPQMSVATLKAETIKQIPVAYGF